MNGLECLKQEMYARGCTKSQVESKTMLIVLEILSNDKQGVYADLNKALERNEFLKEHNGRLEDNANRLRQECLLLEREKADIKQEIKEFCDRAYREVLERIDKFTQALEACETAEAKDTLRRAQMFCNSVDVDTKYDNTAFIIGLASILASGNIAPMDELCKINTKLPKPSVSLSVLGNKVHVSERLI